MAVVIANSMVVGKLNAGKLRPKKPGDIDSPNDIESESAGDIEAPNDISAIPAWRLGQVDESFSDVGFDDGIRIGKPVMGEINALHPTQISAPNQISAEQASHLQAARELDAISAPFIAAPNQINAIPDDTSPPFDMRHARILYDNALSDASGSSLVRSPNTYEKSTGTTFTLTMPSSRPVDCIAALGVLEGVTVTLEYSTSTGGSFVTVASVTPDNNRPVMALFDEVSARRIRITLSSSRAVINLSAGVALQMQRPIFGGHNPITMSRQTEYQSRRSESGNFVSRNIVRKGLSGSYEWSNLTDDWVREYFDPFIIAARKTPFYIAWRPESYPDEVAYAWTTGDISPNNIGTRNLMSVGMDVQAYGD